MIRRRDLQRYGSMSAGLHAAAMRFHRNIVCGRTLMRVLPNFSG